MILDPTIYSSPTFKVNLSLIQGEDFDYRIIRYTDISRRERWDFSGYTAKLEIFDEIRPQSIYCTLNTGNGIELYDGEIRIYISPEIISSFSFDTAEYRLTLTDNLNRSKLFMRGKVYLELGTTPLCQQE